MTAISLMVVFVAALYGYRELMKIKEGRENAKKEKEIRKRFEAGDIEVGSIWRNTTDSTTVTIELITNWVNSISKRPLMISYMSEKGYSILTCSAVEFIEKFNLIDTRSNEVPNSFTALMALAKYQIGKTDFPKEGTVWQTDQESHGVRQLDYKQATVVWITERQTPCPYVIFKDEHGTIRTITLHNFRRRHVQVTDKPHTYYLDPDQAIILNASLERESNIEVVATEPGKVTFNTLTGHKWLESGFPFTVGERYQAKDNSLIYVEI